MQFWPGCCCGDECGSIRVTVRLCSNSSLVSGAVVTVRDGGGSTVGSATTDGTGIVEIDIPAAATYDVEVVKTGQVTAHVSVAATCTTNNVTVELGRVLVVTATGCVFGAASNVIAGAAVVASLSGVIYSGTTDGSGVVSIPVQANGTYSVAIGDTTGRLTYSGTKAVTCTTNTLAAQMVAASGYHCIAWTTFGCAKLPIADTLFLTDSQYGTCTLVYNPAALGGVGAWEGTKTVTVPACAIFGLTCPEMTGITFIYALTQASYTITAVEGGFGALSVRWKFDGTANHCAEVGTPDSNHPIKITAVTCPTAGAFSASMVWIKGSHPACNRTQTITITE